SDSSPGEQVGQSDTSPHGITHSPSVPRKSRNGRPVVRTPIPRALQDRLHRDLLEPLEIRHREARRTDDEPFDRDLPRTEADSRFAEVAANEECVVGRYPIRLERLDRGLEVERAAVPYDQLPIPGAKDLARKEATSPSGGQHSSCAKNPR